MWKIKYEHEQKREKYWSLCLPDNTTWAVEVLNLWTGAQQFIFVHAYTCVLILTLSILKVHSLPPATIYNSANDQPRVLITLIVQY